MWTVAGAGFVVVALAAFGLIVSMSVMDGQLDNPDSPRFLVLRQWLAYVYPLSIGTIAALSLTFAWFWSGMSRKPSPKAGLLHIALSMLTAAIAIAFIFSLLLLSADGVMPVGAIAELVFYMFIIALGAAFLITGPIAFPVGWFVGRWAQRLHNAANAPEAVAETFA